MRDAASRLCAAREDLDHTPTSRSFTGGQAESVRQIEASIGLVVLLWALWGAGDVSGQSATPSFGGRKPCTPRMMQRLTCVCCTSVKSLALAAPGSVQLLLHPRHATFHPSWGWPSRVALSGGSRWHENGAVRKAQLTGVNRSSI